MLRFLIVFLFILILPVFSSASDSTGTDIFAWETKGPLEFLDFLKNTEDVSWCFTVNEGLPPCKENTINDCSFKSCQYIIMVSHTNWVSAKDIPALIKLINSETPCSSVASVVSSYISPGISTVGHEAAFIIEGFRKGKYPPHLNSSRWQANKIEILEWWNNYQKGNLTNE